MVLGGFMRRCPIVDHAIAEATRPYTGGIPAYRYLREEWSKGGEVRTPPAKDKAVEEELQALRKRVEIMEALAREGGGGAADKASEKPEDVIREFMAKGLNMGGFGKKNEQIFKVKSSLSPSQHNNSI